MTSAARKCLLYYITFIHYTLSSSWYLTTLLAIWTRCSNIVSTVVPRRLQLGDVRWAHSAFLSLLNSRLDMKRVRFMNTQESLLVQSLTRTHWSGKLNFPNDSSSTESYDDRLHCGLADFIELWTLEESTKETGRSDAHQVVGAHLAIRREFSSWPRIHFGVPNAFESSIFVYTTIKTVRVV